MGKEIKRETKMHGIVEVVETAYPQGQYPPDPEFGDWFHSIAWLEAELAAAETQAKGRVFRPYTDWGWYVERMIAETGIMYHARSRGDIDLACITARELGMLMIEAKMKFDWEDDALRGRAVGRGLRDAAATTNALHAPLREKRFARLRELIPQIGLQSAAYQCEVEGLGKAGAILRQWNRHKEKSDT